MGKKTRQARENVRAEVRSIITRQREASFPTQRVTSVDTEALDEEINRRGIVQAKAESAAIISRISARFRR